MNRRRNWSVATLLGTVIALGMVFSAAAIAWTAIFDRSDTGNLAFYTPDRIKYWGGWQNSNVSGGWGRHIYASADPYWQDQNTTNAMWGQINAANGLQAPAISFDEQARQGNNTYQYGLHATGWFAAWGYGGAEYWSQDDNGDGRREEAKITWLPPNPPVNANVEVEFWDPNSDTVNQWTNTSGRVNVSAYWIGNPGRYRISSVYLGAYCFEQNNTFVAQQYNATCP